MSAAADGYFAASASRSPISTSSAGTTPGHSVLPPRNQASLAEKPRGVEGVAGDVKLHPLPAPDIGTDDDVFDRPVVVEHEHLERIAEIVVVELAVPDAVQPDRRGRRHQEIERRAQRPAIGEGRRQPARRDRRAGW